MLEAKLDTKNDAVVLTSPTVGLWREAPVEGTLVRPGDRIGRIEVLGVLHEVIAPARADGVVVERGGDDTLARRPIDYGDLLLRLDPEVVGSERIAAEEDTDATAGDRFLSPSSGRFYSRPTPDSDAFVQAGDTIHPGEPVCILEVMKTFNRVLYDGETAQVVRVLPADGNDIEQGDTILELE